MLSFQAIVYGFWAISMVFFSCEIAQRLSIAYEKINDEIDQFDWHLLPMEIQRILLTIMIHTQQPVEVLCFGSTACNRGTFKKVCRTNNRPMKMK